MLTLKRILLTYTVLYKIYYTDKFMNIKLNIDRFFEYINFNKFRII